MQIDQILWKMMEFHDFPRILGKSGCQSHPPAKFCAGPAWEAPVPESFRVYAKCFPGATHGIVLRTRLGLIPPVSTSPIFRSLVAPSASEHSMNLRRHYSPLAQRAICIFSPLHETFPSPDIPYNGSDIWLNLVIKHEAWRRVVLELHAICFSAPCATQSGFRLPATGQCAARRTTAAQD